jgi:hypothetical protein
MSVTEGVPQQSFAKVPKCYGTPLRGHPEEIEMAKIDIK